MRRALKITAWTLGGLLATVLVLVIAVLITANTNGGRRLIERATARLTHDRVQLAGLAGSFPSSLDLGRLQLSDDQGVWLTAEHISLRWSPLALLTRHIKVESLTAVRLHIERRPVSKPQTKSRQLSVPHTDVARVSVDMLELGAPLAGRPVSLMLQGSAHLRSLQDAVASIAVQRSGGLGDYELRVRFDPTHMEATLTAREPANGPLENILKVPGVGDLSLLAKMSGPRTAENIDIALDAGKLRGRVQGTVDLVARSADLQYSFDSPEMTPAPQISWQSLSLHGQWRGTLEQGSADGMLQLHALQLPDGLGMSALTANLTMAGGTLRLHSVLEGGTIPGPQPWLLHDSPLTLDASMRMIENGRPLQLSATHRLFTLSGRAVTSGAQSADLELRIPDVSPVATVLRQQVQGNASIKAQIAHTESTTRLTADATGVLDAGAAIWAGAVRGGVTRLQLSGEMSEKELSVQRLSLTGPALSLALSGTAARSVTRDLNLQLDLGLPDLAKVSAALTGNAKLSGKLSGPVNNLATTTQLISTLSVRGSPTGTITANVRASGLPKAPRGNLAAQGSLDGAPLVLDVSLLQEAGHTLHAIVHRADWKSAHARGELSTGTDIEHARGMLEFQMGQLSDLDRLVGTTVQGAVSGQVALQPGKNVSTAQIRVDVRDVKAGGITASGQLNASGVMDALSLHLSAQSSAVAGASADVSSAATLNARSRELLLSSLDAHYHGQKLSLLAPAKLSFAEGFSVSRLRLGMQAAELDLEGRLTPTLDIRASLAQVKPALINAFIPDLLATGTLRAEAQVKGSLSAPEGEVHAEAVGVRSASEDAAGMPAVDLHAAAELMRTTAVIDAKLSAGKASQIILSGKAPLSYEGAFNLKLNGNIDVGVLNPLTEPSGKHVAGEVTVDTTVTGNARQPEIKGTVRLVNGSLRDYTQGTNLSDITAELTGSNGLLRIEKLTARAPPGDVAVTGTIGVLQKGVPVDLKLVARNAQPIASNILTANLGAELTVTGTARERLDVAGRVSVNRANVQIPNGLPPNVAVLDVRRPGKAPPPPRSQKRLVIGLSVTLAAPRQILVKGRGLDAELGGEIRIRGTTAAPQVTGGFDLLRGSFTLASSHLNFTQGSVTFSGEGLRKKIDPTLDFTAQANVSDITATVRITGQADAPKIELSSSPDMPQDEILARLLFGVSASQLSALQVAQIGAALASLGGGGGGFNPLEKIQNVLGLDRLTVAGGTSSGSTAPGASNNSNSGASIEAGRYVNSRVFVGVKQSTTGWTQLAVDVDVAKRLKLQAKVGNGTATAQGTTPSNDPGSSLGVAYQWEY
jgi:translocation and assembly module TamB